MLNKLTRVWELPPKETLRKVKRILTGKGGTMDMEEIANSPRLMRSQRFYDFLAATKPFLPAPAIGNRSISRASEF